MTDDQMFAAISRRACPALADTLLAVTAAWREVDWADVARREGLVPAGKVAVA